VPKLGVLNSLFETMIAPLRRYRVTAPLAAATSGVLLACAFWFDDSAVFGFPIDYAVIGIRLPHTVFYDHGWSGLAVWIGSAFLFTTALAFWGITLYEGKAPRLRLGDILRRSLLFFAANLVMPTLYVPIGVTVYYGILEETLLGNDRYGFSSLSDAFPDFPEMSRTSTIVVALLIWLFLRLAIWPTMILLTGWRGALRRSGAAGRGLSLRILSHIAVMAFAAEKVFDVLSFLFYQLQFALIDYTAFDTVILVAISGIGIVCTILLGYWISALMVQHMPRDLFAGERSTPDPV